jgi:hypothetical protein
MLLVNHLQDGNTSLPDKTDEDGRCHPHEPQGKNAYYGTVADIRHFDLRDAVFCEFMHSVLIHNNTS